MAPPPSNPISVAPSSQLDLFHLRSLTNTLTNVPEPSLPAEIPTIVTTLVSIPILETAFRTSSTKNEDVTVLLHKYKTRISSLLQSRSPQGRWAGVALVKATVESSPEALSVWAKSWVPLIVALLGHPEPTTTLQLALATLSLIFNHLTASKPTLTRELTTPNLKPFIETVLNLLSPPTANAPRNTATDSPTLIITDSPILLTSALRALVQTISVHSTTFRPFVKRTQSIILSILGSLPYPLTEEVEFLAREVLVILHLCASPSSRGSGNEIPGGERNTTANAVSAEWSRLLRATISDLNVVLDNIFAPVFEDSDVNYPIGSDGTGSSKITLGLVPSISNSLSENLARTLLLFRLLTTFFTAPTNTPVTTPLSSLLTLTQRILMITPRSARHNPIYPSSSRDALFTVLPHLHTAALSLLDLLARRLGQLFVPVALSVLERVSFIWDFASYHTVMRTSIYILLTTLLRLCGASIPRGSTLKRVMKITDKAVDDILAPYTALKEDVTIIANSSASTSGKRKKGGVSGATGGKSSTTATLADTLLNTTTISSGGGGAHVVDVQYKEKPETRVAVGLIETLLSTITAQRIPSELRTKIDKMAISTNERGVLLAGVLFPPSYVRGSVLPFLVGGLDGINITNDLGVEMGVQGVIWPRMPVVKTGGEENEEKGDDEEGEDEGEGNGDQMDVDANVDIDSRRYADGGGVVVTKEDREAAWERALRPTTTSRGTVALQPQTSSTVVAVPAAASSAISTATATIATPALSKLSQEKQKLSSKHKPTQETQDNHEEDDNNNDDGFEDTIHVTPVHNPLTPAAKQLHKDLRGGGETPPPLDYYDLRDNHPQKRIRLSPPKEIEEVVNVGGKREWVEGEEGDDEDEEMVIPEIDVGESSDDEEENEREEEEEEKEQE